MQKEYINEVVWGKMFNFFQDRKDIYIGSEAKLRGFVTAFCWVLKSGADWRSLPSTYGKWNSVFKRFNEWSKKNIWHDFFQFCIQDPDLEWVMIDSTIVRAHQCASGYKKGQAEEQGLGRSKGGLSSKIHIITDALGNPLKFIVTPGQRSDITQAQALADGIQSASVLADKGYDCDAFRALLSQQECIPVIPFRINRKGEHIYDKELYKERNIVESFISKIKQFRRIFSRYDKSLRNYMSLLLFAGALVWLR